MPRNVNSRFMRARDADPDAEEGSSDGRRQRARSSGSRRGRSPLVRPHDMPEEERRTPDTSDEEELVWQMDAEGDEAQQAARLEAQLVQTPLLWPGSTCEVP